MNRTLQPSRVKRRRRHGFLARSSHILAARRRKGRRQLTPSVSGK